MVDSARDELRRELIESSIDRAPLRTELRLLDDRGRIRFTSHSAADLARHVAVLSGGWGE